MAVAWAEGPPDGLGSHHLQSILPNSYGHALFQETIARWPVTGHLARTLAIWHQVKRQDSSHRDALVATALGEPQPEAREALALAMYQPSELEFRQLLALLQAEPDSSVFLLMASSLVSGHQVASLYAHIDNKPARASGVLRSGICACGVGGIGGDAFA